MTDSKPNLKDRALHEFARFATMFAYLWAMFLLFQIHQYVVLAQHHIPFTRFGVGLLNALVLAKVMLVADDLRLGEWRARRPLIYPVLLRSALFAIVFIVFDIVEKMLIGVVHDGPLEVLGEDVTHDTDRKVRLLENQRRRARALDPLLEHLVQLEEVEHLALEVELDRLFELDVRDG